MASLQHAQPGFLYQVVDRVAAAEQVGQVAHQAVLVLLDQYVQQRDIPLLETSRNLACFGVSHARKCPVLIEHTRGIRCSRRKLRRCLGRERKRAFSQATASAEDSRVWASVQQDAVA
jgi:hypothetical protein